MRVKTCQGFTLIELVAFIVIVSVALVALVSVFSRATQDSVDPLIQIRALECAQAKMDEVLARKFDENTPTGGVPACDTFDAGTNSCAGILADTDLDDVGDYNGHTDTSKDRCSISVTVTEAGTDLGLASDAEARRIDVTANSDGGGQAILSAYKVNF
ncbi:MAG: hypothetical protein AseanaTS_17020 [Candidatus Pelagadaptatus aseana]|uniref:type IV pilus modification PilV family protein n=1 Tax=Candidatus Pelagadaptatus aseana TaxID=3120508 RepID=UPI0039B16307